MEARRRILFDGEPYDMNRRGFLATVGALIVAPKPTFPIPAGTVLTFKLLPPPAYLRGWDLGKESNREIYGC